MVRIFPHAVRHQPTLRTDDGSGPVQLQGGPPGDQGRLPARPGRIHEQDFHTEAAGPVLWTREGVGVRRKSQQGKAFLNDKISSD